MDKQEKHLHRYKICPECSFFCNETEKDNYCSYCGAKLILACPNCNKPIENPYAKFCKYCGKNYPGRETNFNNNIK